MRGKKGNILDAKQYFLQSLTLQNAQEGYASNTAPQQDFQQLIVPVALSVYVPQPTSVVQNVKVELCPAVTAATGLDSSPLGFISTEPPDKWILHLWVKAACLYQVYT